MGIGAAAALLSASAFAGSPDKEWLPVTDAERTLKAPVVDKEAGAEALFWHVHLTDQEGEDIHYKRVKIFDERGAKNHGTVDIQYWGNNTISGIAGRTIKPDGTIVELRKDAIFNRDIVKAGGVKVKAVSFVMPGVEPGAIIEYRWRESRVGLANYMRLQFQTDIPAHEVKYFLKPLAYYPYVMRAVMYHAPLPPIVKEKDGSSSVSLTNVPAYKEEPMMPPAAQVRPWMLIYYAEDKKPEPEKFWVDFGKRQHEVHKPFLKPNGDVRRAAAEIVSGTTDPEQQLARLMRYCRTKIKDLHADDVTANQRAKAKDNDSPGDTLKRGIGSGFDINMLFGAMAAAVGFDVRVARLADRSDLQFDRTFTDGYYMRAFDIAVKVNGQWRFYDAAAYGLPAGMLSWREEGVAALVSDPKQPEFVETPVSGPEKSVVSRTGTFNLKEDGALEGEMRILYTGHAAAERRTGKKGESAARREEDIRDMVRSRFSNAEVSDVKVENVEDAEQPLTYACRVKVPAYGQRTGKRLFLQPSFFQVGLAARFPASERRYPVFFDYPWTEVDEVTVNVPHGFGLESPEAPAPIGFGELGRYDVGVKVGQGKVVYKRQLVFGSHAVLRFPLKVYPALKAVFDAVHDADNFSLTLRQQAVAAKGAQ